MLERIDDVLHETLKSYGEEFYLKFLGYEVFRRWQEIVGKVFDLDDADKLKPVKIEHKVLFVEVEESAFKDQLKFFEEELIDAVNETCGKGHELINSIQVAKTFSVASRELLKLIDAKPLENKSPDNELDAITLTEAELDHCRKLSEKSSDPQRREKIFNLLVSRAKFEKLKTQSGWHKCARCDLLCEPEETLCVTCRIAAREDFDREVRKLLNDSPYLKFGELKALMLRKFPLLKSECTPETINSIRTSLIQELAARVKFGDETSRDALKLVMLERQARPEQLTRALIHRTLTELRFNLAEQPKFSETKFTKLKGVST